MSRGLRCFVILCAASLLPSLATADEPVNFQGKTITMIVGFPPGGGTDIAARVMAQNLGRHLPGSPTVVVQNVPGAEGITAMNYFVQQVRPDGLNITMGSASLGDPVHYRTAQAKYDPTQLNYIAGTARGGSVLVINAAAEPRLFDKHESPVVMGSTIGVPRSGMLMSTWGTEFLGWNTKWVIGYPGTSDLMLALDRGEIDMTSTSNLALVQKLVGSGRFKILSQGGALQDGHMVAHAGMADAPVFENLMQGKIKDPVGQKSFKYWLFLNDLDKWFALPAGTPAPVVSAYRDAYRAMLKDPQFVADSKKIGDDFEPRSGDDVKTLITALADTPPEAIAFIDKMLRKEGLTTE